MLLDYIINLSPLQIYLTMCILMFTNGLFLFPSSQGILVISGFLASINPINWYLLFTSLIVFNILGNYVLYIVSYKWGEQAVRKVLPINKKKLDNDILFTKYIFDKYGEIIILVARNLTILHSLISVPAGIAKTSQRKFLIFTSIGITIWSTIFFGLGMHFGSDYENLFGLFNIILMSVTITITIGLFYYVSKYKKNIINNIKIAGGEI